jgi:uncharacterized protein YjbI with pentapeptide repeats
MPYDLPAEQAPAADASAADHARFETRTQERQVRLTAQHILTTHVQPGDNIDEPVPTFWPNIDLDLTGATLIDLDLSCCHLRATTFDGARFTGHTTFIDTRFARLAKFIKAHFTDSSYGSVQFNEARFADLAVFNDAQFDGGAHFLMAKFDNDASFIYALAPIEPFDDGDDNDTNHLPYGWELVPAPDLPSHDEPGFEWGRMVKQ